MSYLISRIEGRFLRRIVVDYFTPLLAAALGCLVTLYVLVKWDLVGIQSRSGSGSIRVKDTNSLPGVRVGETIYPPRLPSIHRAPADLGLLRGRPALYGFFSAACASCALDSQAWRRLYSEAAKNGSDFFLVGLDQTRDEITRFADEHGLGDIPILYDPKGEAKQRFKIQVFPQYILLASDGKVVLRWSGVSFGRQDQNESFQIDKLFRSMP